MIPASAAASKRKWLALVLATWLLAGLSTVARAACPFAQAFHQPCPGCGMTRALLLLARGEVAASFSLQPLAVPTLLAQLGFAAYTVWLTAARGTPLGLLGERSGRRALSLVGLVGVACVGLWLARFGGAFGGPVPVAP